MTQKCFVYCSESRLSCGNCLPADVIICVSTGKVANQLCPDQQTEQPFTYSTIEGSVVSQTKQPGACNSTIWKYTVCYDEDDIIAGQTLAQADVSGLFCKGCLAQWVEDIVGNEIQVEYDADEQEVSITSQHGCVTTFPVGGSSGVDWTEFIFGDGIDGDFTVLNGEDVGFPDPARDYFYDNVTVDDGGVLNMYGLVNDTPFCESGGGG